MPWINNPGDLYEEHLLLILRPSAEASEIVVLEETAEMAFPLHERVVEDYFAGMKVYR